MDRDDTRRVLDILAEVERREADGNELEAAAIAAAVGASLPLATYVLRARERGQPPRLLGRYGLVEAIGHGAMGVVWWARDFDLARDVALKELSPNHARNPEALRRFRREAAAAAKLSHPNLLPIFEIASDGDSWFYAMELVNGSSLHEQVEMSREAGTPGPAEDLAGFLERYASFADAVHVANEAGIVHRDIKPSNIMVDGDGTLLLVDFGLARDTDRERMTNTDVSIGTPMYMSPEQFAGRTNLVDRRADVYALGITLYEVLTLRAPYSESSLEEMARQVLAYDPPSPRGLGLRVPAEVEHIIFRAIEKDPARRYPTAAAFAEDLRNFIHHRPIAARPQGRFVRLRKSLARNRSAIRVLGLTLGALMLATFGVWIAYRWKPLGWTARLERQGLEHKVRADRLGLPLEDVFFEGFLLDPRERGWRLCWVTRDEGAWPQWADGKITGVGHGFDRLDGTPLKYCRLYRATSIAPGPGFKVEFRGRAGAASPNEVVVFVQAGKRNPGNEQPELAYEFILHGEEEHKFIIRLRDGAGKRVPLGEADLGDDIHAMHDYRVVRSEKGAWSVFVDGEPLQIQVTPDTTVPDVSYVGFQLFRNQSELEYIQYSVIR